MTLVLASTSSYRRVLLERLGVPFVAEAHACDERAVQQDGALEEHAVALASAKAQSLAKKFPESYILGSDQIAEVGGTVLHKPGTKERACAQLAMLSGRTHRLLTAIALRGPDGSVQTALDVHTMHMRTLSAEEISRYVDADSPLDCCGSYKIECRGIALFERIDGADFTAITGMPLTRVSTLLRGVGFAIP